MKATFAHELVPEVRFGPLPTHHFDKEMVSIWSFDVSIICKLAYDVDMEHQGILLSCHTDPINAQACLKPW